MKDQILGETTPDPEIAETCDAKAVEGPREIRWKKKLINDPNDVVKEEVEGFLAAQSLRNRRPVLHLTHIEFIETQGMTS